MLAAKLLDLRTLTGTATTSPAGGIVVGTAWPAAAVSSSMRQRGESTLGAAPLKGRLASSFAG
jgi:hypothetical protein